MRDEILRLTPADDTCESVLESELAAIGGGEITLRFKGITSLLPGDFDGTNLDIIRLDRNNLTELPAKIFSGLTDIFILLLNNNSLAALPSGVFSDLPNLGWLALNDNQLRELPAGIFSGLALFRLHLENNPNAPFQFTVRFEPKALDKDFTTASVRLTLREGAPRTITVPLSATGATLSANSLTLTRGNIQSTVVTVSRSTGNKIFELSQGELALSGDNSRYSGFEIVPGPSLTTASFTYLRIRAFLEGALE